MRGRGSAEVPIINLKFNPNPKSVQRNSCGAWSVVVNTTHHPGRAEMGAPKKYSPHSPGVLADTRTKLPHPEDSLSPTP